MTVSYYSCFMALFWFALFLTTGDFLRRKTGFLSHYNFYTLLTFIALSFARLLLPVELPFTMVIRSKFILPALKKALAGSFMSVMGIPISPLMLILLVWGAVAFYKLIKLFRCIRHDRIILQTISSVEDTRASRFLEEIASKPKAKHRLIVSPDIYNPMLLGLMRPVILLPQLNLDDDNTKLFLLHEWQHIANKDQWIKLIVNMIGCIMWWIPAAKRLEEQAEAILELRCDLKLTEKMNDDQKSNYLKALLLGYDRAAKAWEEKNYFSFASRFANAESTKEAVKERFEIIHSHKNGARAFRGVVWAIVCALFALSFLFVFQPYYNAPTEEQGYEMIELNKENSYITKTEGRYVLYHNGVYLVDVPEDKLDDAPYSQLEIIEKQ